MKPVLRNVLAALGLLPLSVLGDGLLEPTRYEGQANITGMYGSQNSSYAEADFWQPVWQRADRVAFVDIRGVKGEGSQWEGNAGGGYRWLAFDEQFLFGTYGFYDYKNSALNNGFQQLTLGGEIKTLEWTGRANYYVGLGSTSYRAYQYDTWKWSAPNANGYQNLLISEGYEYGLGGFDAEAGRVIPGVKGLTAYAGMFYFNNSDINQSVVGPRLRVEYDLTEVADIPLTWAHGWVKNAKIESAWQYDSVRGNLWSIGLQLSIPFSNKSSTVSKNDLTSRMTEYVRRDVNVVSVAKTGLTDYKAYTQNGAVVEFAQIENSTQFNALLHNTVQPDVYLINADVETYEGSIQLGDNLTFTGGEFEYAPGHNLLLNPAIPTITAPENSDLFIVGKNNTFEDMNLVVTQTNGADPYYVLKNTGSNPRSLTDQTGLTVGTLAINNITANGAIFIAVGDGSQDSTITVTHNTFTMGSTSGVNTKNAAIDIEAWNGSKTGITHVDNNHISFGSNSVIDIARGIYLMVDAGAQTISSVSGNTIVFGDDVGTGSGTVITGIYFYNPAGVQIINSVKSNAVTFGDSAGTDGGTTYGVRFINWDTQTITAVNNNTITFGDRAGTGTINRAYGIYFYNDSTQTITSANSNKVTFGDNAGTASQAYGIYFYNRGEQTISSANSDTVTFGDNAGTASGTVIGIRFENASAQTISSADSNTVTFGDSAGTEGGRANGISLYSNGTQQTVNGMMDNTVTGLIGTPSNLLADIYILSQGGTITINIHGTTGTAVTGSASQQLALSTANNDAGVYIGSGSNIIMTT